MIYYYWYGNGGVTFNISRNKLVDKKNNILLE